MDYFYTIKVTAEAVVITEHRGVAPPMCFRSSTRSLTKGELLQALLEDWSKHSDVLKDMPDHVPVTVMRADESEDR